MKRLSFLVACAIFVSTPCTFADTFDFSAGLRESVRSELIGSALARSKAESVADICRKRIRLLKAMAKDGRARTVMQEINVYMKNAHLHAGDFEITQLRRSENFAQLVHNANSIIKVYRALWSEVRDTGSGGTDVARAAVTTKSKKRTRSSEKKWSGSRPDRQNETHNGRSRHK